MSTTIANLVGAGGEKALAPFVEVFLKPTNTIINSGLAARSPIVDMLAGQGPRKVSVPYVNPLLTNEVNISNDVLTDQGKYGNITADEFSALRHDLNYAWGTTDLTQIVTQWNVKGGIAAAMAAYWNGVFTKMATSVMVGALKNTGLTYTSAAGESMRKAVIKATGMAGQFQDSFDILIASAARYNEMRVDDTNAFVPASKSGNQFDEWAGFKLIKSDAFGNDLVVARSGALAFGEGSPAGLVPYEIERIANGANGGGGDLLHSRKSVIIHPQGFHYAGTVAPTVLKNGPTAPALETMANWTKEVPDEMIGFRKVVLTPAT